MLRRGAAAALLGKPPPLELSQETRGLTNLRAEEVRSQAMGQVNGIIYEKSYRNQVIDADIISAFLEIPSDEAIMKLMGHMSLARDPQRRKVRTNLEVIAAKRLVDISTKGPPRSLWLNDGRKEKDRGIKPCKSSLTTTQSLKRTVTVPLTGSGYS